jgi:hypothetical protein
LSRYLTKLLRWPYTLFKTLNVKLLVYDCCRQCINRFIRQPSTNPLTSLTTIDLTIFTNTNIKWSSLKMSKLFFVNYNLNNFYVFTLLHFNVFDISTHKTFYVYIKHRA